MIEARTRRFARERILEGEHFEALLSQLSSDREEAGVCYEQLRQRLITVFTYRGCADPEQLADETLDRVARKVFDATATLQGIDPAPFVFAVAWNVARESFRGRQVLTLIDDAAHAEPAGDEMELEAGERRQSCLDDCLDDLPRKDRVLVLTYFHDDKGIKIKQRALLAQELRITPNALRLRIYRITAALRQCVTDCVGEPLAFRL